MRCSVVTLALVACAEPHVVMKPLPPLQAPAPPSVAREIVVHELGLERGEHWIWDVQMKGLSIGRIELVVGEQQIESHFRTNPLASMVASIEHDLVTVVDRAAARPQTSSERLELAGKLRQFSTQFAGTTAHSIHSALGAVRTWARPDALPGYLDVVHADQTFRFELSEPLVSHGMVRVDGKITGSDIDPLSLTIWFDAAHVPAKIELRDGDERVTAELIAS
jgi:hypothetical protein